MTYTLTISSNPLDANANKVFYHPIAEDRVGAVVELVMAPRDGDSPEQQLLNESWISQKMFNKIVRARNASDQRHSQNVEG